jgi:beta-galactosidase
MKPNSYYRQSIWTEKPMVYLAIRDTSIKSQHVRGRWSFPQMASHLNFDHFAGKPVHAAVFTNCDEAELWINGKKLGRRRPSDFDNRIIDWDFEYAAGEIKVLGYRKGAEVCSYVLKTAGAPARLLLTADKLKLAAGCSDVAHVEVAVVDEAGVLCPNEEALVEFALSGDGELVGACSPDVTAALGYSLPKTLTFGGRALVVVKAGDGAGELTLRAYSGKLEGAAVDIGVV